MLSNSYQNFNYFYRIFFFALNGNVTIHSVVYFKEIFLLSTIDIFRTFKYKCFTHCFGWKCNEWVTDSDVLRKSCSFVVSVTKLFWHILCHILCVPNVPELNAVTIECQEKWTCFWDILHSLKFSVSNKNSLLIEGSYPFDMFNFFCLNRTF